MNEQPINANQSVYNAEAWTRWEALASWWGAAMGEGDSFHRDLIFPTIEKLLPSTDLNVLDLACGTGQTTRFLSKMAGQVFAVDFSPSMLHVAREASARFSNITFAQGDLLDAAYWTKQSVFSADIAVLSMALHDIAAVDPIACGLGQIATVQHVIVIAPHPAFNAPKAVRFTEHRQGETWDTIEGVKVMGYGSDYTANAKAKANQPEPQLVFHRTIESLVQPFFEHGWAIDKFVEPSKPDKCGGVPLVLGLRFVRLRAQR